MNVRHLRPENLKGLRFRGYVRESTAAQADGWSPERQRSDILRAADELGLVAVEPTFYERTGSGEAESAELVAALADARRGQYDVLLVLTTSRFARNRAEAVRVKTLFRKAGIPIYFVHERIVSGSRDSGLNEGIREVLDENENETRRMWIAGGQRERMLSGRWLGQIPVGYRRVVIDFPDGTRRWDGGLEPDPERAPVVRRIFAAFESGTSPLDIAYALNAEGVRGPQGPWTRATLAKILRNPVYKGDLARYRHTRPTLHYYPEDDATDGRRTIEGVFEAIIPEAEWAQVQTLMDGRVVAGSAQRRRRRYPLSGLLRCGECRRRLSGVSNGYSRYYRCRSRAADRSCAAPFVRADVAEAAFASWIGSLTLPPDWREAIAETRQPAAEADTKRERLEERLARLRNLYTWGEMPEDEYRAETARVHSELAEVAEPSPSSMEEVAAALVDLARTWANASPDRQAAVARLMLKEIVTSNGQVTVFMARAEIRPLLDLCVARSPDLLADTGCATEYSA
jgi:DNA invertase Pin-like site-specific DNA recombinase